MVTGGYRRVTGGGSGLHKARLQVVYMLVTGVTGGGYSGYRGLYLCSTHEDLPHTVFPVPFWNLSGTHPPWYYVPPSQVVTVMEGKPFPFHTQEVRSDSGLSTDQHGTRTPLLHTPSHTQIPVPSVKCMYMYMIVY